MLVKILTALNVPAGVLYGETRWAIFKMLKLRKLAKQEVKERQHLNTKELTNTNT